MKFRHILHPVTDGGKLMKLLREYQSALAFGGEPKDPQQVAETLLRFDSENARLGKPSVRVNRAVAALWSQYCEKK